MKKIALDPGHFGGTLSKIEDRHFSFPDFPPIKEGDLTFEVAELLSELLNERGAKVLISRKNFNYFMLPEKFSFQEYNRFKLANWADRAKSINDFKPDLTLAIHFNANCYSSNMKETEFNGVMVFISTINNSKIIKASEAICKNLSADFALPFCEKDWFPKEVSNSWKNLGNGVFERDLYILSNVKTPIVLTESPLMNNKEVYEDLIKGKNIIKIYANSLFKSICEIFENSII